MALSFLYMALVRIFQLLGLLHRDEKDLAIQVVVLRHEVAVLRRQVGPPGVATYGRRKTSSVRSRNPFVLVEETCEPV